MNDYSYHLKAYEVFHGTSGTVNLVVRTGLELQCVLHFLVSQF